jgi:acyl dehydratase
VSEVVNYVRSMARLVARELRREPCSLRGQRLEVERDGLRVGRRRLARYLRATAGSDLACFQGADALLPPLFPATWEVGLALELLCDPRAPSVRRGVVHLQSEVLLIRPLRAADRFRCRLELERAEGDPRGTLLHLVARSWNGSGQLGCESRSTLLVRGAQGAALSAGRADGGRAAAVAATHDAGAGAWQELARWRLGSGHGRRYARASGDFNPIHLSRLTALPFGFRRPIVHGFCLEAMAAHALVHHCLDGQPERLRRMRLDFLKPLLLPATAHLELARDGMGTQRVRVRSADGRVYAEGEFGGG